MSVRPALLHAFDPARVSATVLVLLVGSFVLAGTDADAANIRAQVRFDENDVRIVETTSGPRVSMAGLSEAGGDDAPVLPMVVHSFYVPDGYEVREVRAISREEVPVAQNVRLSLREAPLEPQPENVTRSFPAGALEPDAGRHPARPAVSLRSGLLAGHRVHSVALFPVSWDPASLELTVARSIDIEIDLQPAAPSSDLVRERPAPAADHAFRAALAPLLSNPGDLPVVAPALRNGGGGFAPEDLPSVEGSAVEMVIITETSMEATFQTLADWKTKKGVPTVVRTVGWIDLNYPAGADRPERIRMFLQDAYRKWGLYIALMAGDYQQVPPREAYNRFFFGGAVIPTDQYYAGLEGDWNADGDHLIGEGIWQSANDDMADLYPDIFLGRAPVSDPTEASTFVTKSMNYEKSPPVGYVEEVCHLSEVLFPASWEYGVDALEDITLDGKNLTLNIDAEIDPGWTRFNCFQSENTLDRDHALERLSAGHHLLTLMCHGDAFKFSVGNGLNPLIYIADTDTLSNGNRQMVVMATACNPNQFDLESCGESFLNNPNGGAVVCIGPTRVDFPLSATGFHINMTELWFDRGVTAFGASSQINRVPFAALSTTDATPDRWTTLSKNLLGDPEIRFWTEEPKTLLVTHDASVALGTASIAVTVTDSDTIPVAGALVCVSDGMGTYSRARTDAAGMATVPIAATETGSVDVVVTGAEFLPYEGAFTVDAIAGPFLSLTDHTVDDDGVGGSSGNGDGVIDAGETIELSVTVHNGGGATATGAAVMASIEAGGSATFDLTYDGLADPSKVFIGPDRTNPPAIPFTLDFGTPLIDYTGTPPHTFASDSLSGDFGIFLWQDRGGWHVRWGSGADSVEVTGTITTDGRVRGIETLDLETGFDAAAISAGEDSLTFNGWTHGSDTFDGVDVALSDSTMVTVTTASDVIGDVTPSASASGTVVFDVSSSARDEQVAYVDLSFTSGALRGGAWSGVVPIAFAGPELEAYVFAIDDDGTPPSAGDGDGVVEVGETVVLTPTVLNRGSGAAESVGGLATAASGITFVDGADAYGSIVSLGQTSGTDGYVFTVDDSTGTTIDLNLTDSLGRIWMKSIEFVAPVAPESLMFGSTPNSIELRWAPNADADLAGYNVYRSTTSGSGFTRQNFELMRHGSRYADEDLAFGSAYYYHTTAVDSAGNEGPASNEVFGWTTLPQAPGWPKYTASNIFSSLTIIDADASGQGEVYVGSQDFGFYAWSYDGDDIEGFPIATGGQIWGTASFGDVDKDGDEEIFFPSLDSRFYAVHHDSTPVYDDSQTFFTFPAFQGARGSAAIADVDKDAELEIIIGTDWGRVFAFDHDGTGMGGGSGLLYEVTPAGTNSRIWGAIAVGDLDADEQREIAFCSWNDSLYVIEPDGTLEAGFPRAGTLNFRSGPVFADLDDDGTMEVIAGNDDGNLYAFNHDGTDYASGGILASMPEDIRSVPAVANIDGDPELEIFVSCMDGRLYAFEHDGTGILNPSGLFADIDSTKDFSASPIVVDVDGDSDMEILVGHRNGNFYGFHHDGTGIIGMPIPTANEIYATAAAGDLDNDGDVDVAFASYDASVNVIDFSGASSPAAYEWPTYAGNNHRTSSYGEPIPWQTGADTAIGAQIAFALMQNSPNPFVTGTSIGYVVPENGRVFLRIYNVSGRLVRTLVNGAVPAGRNSVVWDGHDQQGQRLASGVYFYRLESADRSLTKKSLLLR